MIAKGANGVARTRYVARLPFTANMPFSRIRLCSLATATFVALLVSLIVSGCATGDFLRAAHRSMLRAEMVEPPESFFTPVLARAKGEEQPPPPSWRARQHYLGVIFNLEGLSAEGEKALKRDGMLGDAFVLKTLAQWRLGRLDDARASALRARASGQEALDAEHRALFRAFEGVMRLHAAFDALAEGKPLEEIHWMVASDQGAWRLLAGARTEISRTSPLQRELILARLAAFKILRDARQKHLEAAGRDTEAWKRLRAEAEVELAELASLPTDVPAGHAAVVEQWQALCGLGAPVAG